MGILKIKKRPTYLVIVLLLSFAMTIISSCSKEDVILKESETETINDEESAMQDPTSCNNPVDFVFNEKDGLVSVEFEKAEFSEDWVMKSDGNSFSGVGYMVWQGTQHLHEPGNGVATFKIKISNKGTYRFVWKSAVKIGVSGTDHNDTWLRFADAHNFYAKKGNSVVYPRDSGKTPNPEGASKEGWFKVFRSGSDLDFKWHSATYDNNGHEIFVAFDSPGTYLMEVSARSSGHGIDKFVLFNESFTLEDATSSSQSTITCN